MLSDGSLLSLVIGSPASCRGAITKALASLLHAADFARLSDRPLWDFATELSELQNLSLNGSVIRWLVLEGLAEMAIEEPLKSSDSAVAESPSRSRTFRPAQTMTETNGLCFVLTENGVRLARELANALPKFSDDRMSSQLPGEDLSPQFVSKPTWIAALRELRAGQTLLKKFRSQAPTQEVVLAAFEEEGWPRRIDDPIAPRPFVECKHRLRSTIQSLNRSHEEPLLRFRADGSGEGIVWEWELQLTRELHFENMSETESPVTTHGLHSYLAAIQPWEAV